MKRNLLLEREMLLFDPWDAMQESLQVTPIMVSDAAKRICFRKSSGFGMTLSVYGTIGISDLTGEKTVEDMEVWCGDGEITNGLSEAFLQDLVHECIENA